MKFGLSEEQTLLQDSVRHFLGAKAPLDRVRKIVSGEDDNREIWRGLVELGIVGLLIPEDQGGVGLGMMEAVIVAECLAYHVTPTAFISSAVIVPAALAAARGHADLLAAIAEGTARVGVAFAEAVGTRADAGITISGGKLSGKSLFALDADADHYLVAVRHSAPDDATSDTYLYLVNAAAIRRNNLASIDKTRSTCELIFDATEALLVSDDPSIFTQALNAGRIILAADTLGAGQNMIDQAVAYARQRQQFGRPIASFQAVKHMCASMAAELEPCRAMVWYAAYAFDNLPEETLLTTCHTKAHISEVGKFVARTSTEVHGGMGFTDLLGLHYWFKRIGFNRQILGTPEALREEAARLQRLGTNPSFTRRVKYIPIHK